MIRRLVVNTASNTFIFFVRIIITFIMTPVFVHNLGNYDYGIWELITVVVGYMGMLDLGIRPTVSRYVAFYNANNDRLLLDTIFSTAIAYMATIGVICFLSLLIIGIYFPEWLSQSADTHYKYGWLLIIIGAQTLISFPGQVIESYLEGYQKYYIKNNITLAFLLISNAILYLYINESNGIILLAIVTTITAFTKFLCFYLSLLVDKNTSISFDHKLITKKSFQLIFSFSLKTFIQGISRTITASIAKIVVPIIDSVNVLIFYAIPANLFRVLGNLISMLSHATMPFFSDLHGKQSNSAIRGSFIFISRILFAINLLVIIGLLMLGSQFITFWIGADYGEKSTPIIYGTSITNIIYSINPLANRYLTAIDKHGLLAKISVIEAFAKTILAVLLVYYLGYVGAAFSGILPALIFISFPLFKTCQYINIKVFDYIKNLLWPVTIPAIILIICIQVIKANDLIGNMYTLIIYSIIVAGIYFVVFIFTGLARNEQKYIYNKIMIVLNKK